LTFFIYVFYRFFTIIFEIVTIAMLIRAITSWIPAVNRNSRFMQLVYVVTEFFIAPVRAVLWKIPFVRSCPLDLSFLATYILLNMAQGLVYSAWIAVAY